TLVGRHAQIRVRVDDPGQSGDAELLVRVDGQDYLLAQVPLNAEATVEVPIRHAGSVFVEVESPAPDGDLLPANNRAALAIPAVRDRMKVLLISGEPHSGERVWRNLLKSDPAVDLVHFTILRPPEKDDRTPIRELALITFPVRELFEEKLGDFDLVIFDRYRHRGIMASVYYERMAQYVRQGGALLVAVGPEYADRDGFADTALAEILPVSADGRMLEKPFVPTVTATGRRHPVTSGLPGMSSWGPWLRQVGGQAKHGQVVLEGADGLPLLVLDQVAQGRVAQLLSDTVWLWARGHDGGGPHDELLRRLAHWLMHEPELEAESLNAQIQGGRLQVTRRSLADQVGAAVVTPPDGRSLPLPLAGQGDGRWLAETPAEHPGLWRVEADGHVALAAQGGIDAPELGQVTATADILRPVVAAEGGSIRFLSEDGVPDIRLGGPAISGGDRWLGLARRDDYLVRGVAQTSLLPAALALVAVVGGLLLAWRRESR
ncbi:MAG: glutamine amidotransferase, partial [Magnetospirillum sp.]|nr:glutamine amidotransferase [Magnetospirillum sp.]